MNDVFALAAAERLAGELRQERDEARASAVAARAAERSIQAKAENQFAIYEARIANLSAQLLDAQQDRDGYQNMADGFSKGLTNLKGRLVEAERVIEFYAANWRCDVYVGPNEELVKDAGEKARDYFKEKG